MLVAAPLAAQGTIRGVVHDSLRARAPVAGAEVVLLGASRRATTDKLGRFEFTDVPAGAATVAFWSLWLDSLSMPPLQAAITVSNGAVTDVSLGTPSLASFQRAVCGVPLAANDGILIGEVRTADGLPVPGVAVGARWHETLVGVGQFERRLRAALDTVNTQGFYALCGVPGDADFALVAGSDSVASGEVVISLSGIPVVRRDLIAGAWTDKARVRGRLLGADSTPVVGATVAVAGDTSLRARTDDAGRFVMDGVPRRTTQFIARAIGKAPIFTERDLFEVDVDLGDIVLGRLAQELSTVTVSGDRVTAGMLQFEHRRDLGRGFFIGDSTLARMTVITSTAVSSMIPRTAVQQTSQGPMLMLRRGMGFCRPRWFVDGLDNGNIDAIEERSLMERAKRIEVYTANMAPPQFNDFDGCGVVVIWTR